jgi:tetratricopeptide (TPR) repeat protein
MTSRSVYNHKHAVQKLLTLGAALLALTASPLGLTERPRLAAIYDSILRARFEQARAQTAVACPPAPIDACRALATVSLWWQIQLDPDSRALDAQLESAAGVAVASAERWTKREPQRAEAWFYFAGAYAPLVQWRILRGERLSAAREALKIKHALERALTIDPGLHDAYFGIGMYHYYADVAPAALRVLRWLLLMPGGNRAEGLREMLVARDSGVLLGGEADYQLHWLYLWYEHDPARALELLRALDARYPSNPIFLQRVAEVQRDDLHDHVASRATWQALLDRARSGQVERSAMAAVRARIGMAEALIAASEDAQAIDAVTPVIDTRATAPYGALSLAHFITARAHERLRHRDRAISSLNAAIASPADDPRDIRPRARSALARMRAQRDQGIDIF